MFEYGDQKSLVENINYSIEDFLWKMDRLKLSLDDVANKFHLYLP